MLHEMSYMFTEKMMIPTGGNPVSPSSPTLITETMFLIYMALLHYHALCFRTGTTRLTETWQLKPQLYRFPLSSHPFLVFFGLTECNGFFAVNQAWRPTSRSLPWTVDVDMCLPFDLWEAFMWVVIWLAGHWFFGGEVIVINISFAAEGASRLPLLARSTLNRHHLGLVLPKCPNEPVFITE